MLVLFADPDPNLGKEQHDFIYQQLGTLSRHAEFTLYLAYIMLYLPQHAADVALWIPYAGDAQAIENIRSRAGLELKNRIKHHWQSMDLGTRGYVQAAALTVLSDPAPARSNLLRNIGGTIVTTVCKKEGFDAWPGILQHLLSLLDSPHAPTIEGGFNALAKICEDMPKELDRDIGGVRPLNFLIPRFIQFFQHPSGELRKYALATVNVFLPVQPQPMALLTNLDMYLQNLFVLAGRDASPEIRRRVCQAFVILLERNPAKIEPHLEQVMQFMLMASSDANEFVRLEACEFWSTYCDRSAAADPDEYEDEAALNAKNLEIAQRFAKDKELLRKYLEHLVPILLQCMCYSAEELMNLGEGEDENDQYQPDKPQNIKPYLHHSQSKQGGNTNAHYPSPAQVSSQNLSNQTEDEDDLNEEEDDDDDGDEDTSVWTLRKCAAAALDALANVYRSELLPFLLPKVQAALNSKGATEAEEAQAWIVRESGVLALGAIAEGCFDKLREFLPMLIPFLITHFLTDKKPLVRSITCWTLSRYCKWIISETINRHGGDHTPYFAPLMKNLLDRMVDMNKKVQEAACSAFATLEEEARMMIVPYLKDILTKVMLAFEKYQANNLLLLYDCLGTLSEAVNTQLNHPELIEILMPPLMRKWHALKDDDRNIFPLLECLTAIAQALGKGFFVFAEPVMIRCMQIIEKNLLQEKEAIRLQQAGHVDPDFPDKEFIVCALDLLSGLAEGLDASIECLVEKHAARILGLLYECVKDLDPDVRQSAFALLGDLAKTCMGHLRPFVDRFLPIAARNLNPSFFSVCNNASWAIGEMAVRAGGDVLAPFVPTILAYLSPILLNCNPNNSKPLLENASITIGRLAFVSAPQVAPYLEKICTAWLTYLAPLRENQEKEHAFKGLMLVIQAKPEAIWQAQAFPALTAALASWEAPSQEMQQMFHTLLHSYKNSLGAQWEATMATCDPQVVMMLRQRYQI